MFECSSCNYLVLLAVGVIGLYLLRKFFKGGQFTENVSARGKVAVVTGGNTGIGLETVKELNLRGAKVYMLCRSEQRADAAKEELVKAGCDSSRLIYVNCDLGSKDNVRECAAKLAQYESQIDILVNNAGVWMGGYEKTKDGHEMTWGTNHLGPFLLTELLLPLVEKAPEGRIVNVSSLLHASSTALDVSTIDSNKGYDTSMAYNRSKLANVMHARTDEKTAHQGKHYRNCELASSNAFFMKTFKDGAQTSLYCALSTEVKDVSGRYFSDCSRKAESPLAMDDLACKQLYDYSLNAVGLA